MLGDQKIEADLIATEVADQPAFPLETPRNLVRKGKVDVAENKIACASEQAATEQSMQQILTALELWSMAQDASNEARNQDAVDLAKRAKRRLNRALKLSSSTDEQLHIRDLLLKITERFPEDEAEIRLRRSEWVESAKKQGRYAQEEVSK